MTPSEQPKPGLARNLFSRTLHSYFLMRRGLTLGVRAIVRSGDGRFLLVRHTYIPGWYFSGGGVEKGQSSVQASSKELHQETGLHLAKAPLLYGVYYNNGVSKRDHVVAYLCDVNNILDAKPNSIEIAEIGLFDFADMPPDVDPGTKRRIREIVLGDAVTESW